MNKPTVSVCMITYNHENYIREAVEGVLMQQCNFEVELILSNDCSIDKTDEVVQIIIQNHPNSSWIQYTNHSQNKGMMPNFIWAMQQCKGKYIALCEGDDYWTDPLKLQKQVDFLEANLNYVLCFHQIDILKTNREIVNDFITKVPDNYETIETLATLGNYIHTPSVVFRNIITEFPFEFEQSPIGDYFLYMMLAEQGKLKYLEEKMAVYRYDVGVLSRMSRLNQIKCTINFYTCLASYIKDEKLKKIIFDKQASIASFDFNRVDKEYEKYFISNHYFFKSIKYLSNNYRNPKKIIKRILFNKTLKLSVIKSLIISKYFSNKINSIKNLDLFLKHFTEKKGIEIGGPSDIFSREIPIYQVVESLDGCNFSKQTVWEGSIIEGENFNYFENKKGHQFICEATNLKKIPNENYDFLIASHCLEHCANTLITVNEWLRVVKKGGVILLILPDRRYTFDHNRPVTTFEHLKDDLKNEINESDLTHLSEILDLHDLSMDLLAGTAEQFKNRSLDNYNNRCLHHHIFDNVLLKKIFKYCNIKVLNIAFEKPNHIIILGIKK